MENIPHIPVVFENCTFIKSTVLLKDNPTRLTITMTQTGLFEITENGSLAVTGKISSPSDSEVLTNDAYQFKVDADILSTKDIYKELRLRGYYYS